MWLFATLKHSKGTVIIFLTLLDATLASMWLQLWHQSELFRLVLKSIFLHFKSSDENLKRSPLNSVVVFQSKLETVMYARGLRGLWYPAKLYLNPHMGMERELSVDNYRESEMRKWKEEGSRSTGDGWVWTWILLFNCMCLIMYVTILSLVMWLWRVRDGIRQKGAALLLHRRKPDRKVE